MADLVPVQRAAAHVIRAAGELNDAFTIGVPEDAGSDALLLLTGLPFSQACTVARRNGAAPGSVGPRDWSDAILQGQQADLRDRAHAAVQAWRDSPTAAATVDAIAALEAVLAKAPSRRQRQLAARQGV